MANKPVSLIWVLFRSLIITFAVSSVLGVCTWYITGKFSSGIVMAFMSIVAQFALSSIVYTLSENKNKKAEFLAEQILKEAADRQLPYDINCAYCNRLNRAGISFNSENSFICTECKQPNKVYIQFSAVRITTPLVSKDRDNTPINMEEADSGVSQSTINEPITVTKG